MLGANDSVLGNLFFDFKEDRDGRVWACNYGMARATAISLKDQIISWIGPDQGMDGTPIGIYSDRQNRIWLATDNIVYIYDSRKNLIKKMITDAPIAAGIFPSTGMNTEEGLIWLGTNRDGVLLIDQDGLLTDHFSDKNGLASNDVWGIEEDSKGRIWLSTYNGLNIYDPKTERLYHLKFPGNISDNSHRQITRLSEDFFFLGSERGFALIDVKKGIVSYFNTAWNKSIRTVFNAAQDKEGALWISGSEGLHYFDRNRKIYKTFTEAGGLISNTVYIVTADRSNRIWVSTGNGTVLIYPESDSCITITEENGISGSYSSVFLESSSRHLYLGSDKGCSILDPDLKTITNLGPEHGLHPPAMYDMIECNNRIHIGSEDGIIVVDPPREEGQPWRFYNYAKSAGIPYNDYNQATAHVASNGDIWWGAAPILTVAHQDPIADTTVPSVRILGISIMDQHLSFSDSSDGLYLANHNIKWDSVQTGFQLPANLKLPHDQNSFNFLFSNQNPRGRDKIEYRFLLEGEDASWSPPTDKPFSRIYYNVSPGIYSFKVITRGQSGIWSQPASFDFIILPPWWQTWWAYLLYAIAAASIIYLVARIRSQMLEKENRMLEKKVQMRTQALRQKMEELKTTQEQLIQSEKMASLGELTAGIAHEIQNPLNFINNFSEINKELLEEMDGEIDRGNLKAVREIAADLKSNEEKIYHHGRRADGIVKSMLQHSRSSINLTKEPADLNKLADEYLRLAYHGLRAKDKSFNSGMTTAFDETIPPVNMIQQDIGRVILNLLTNAFYAVNEKAKTAGPDFSPMVTVGTNIADGQVVLTVRDNGNGIPQTNLNKIFQPFFTTKPTGAGTGLGLSMSYDIVTKVHGGSLTVTSEEGKGTQFSIYLPIKNN